MHYVYTVYKEGIRYTTVHIQKRYHTRCPDAHQSYHLVLECPKWRYHQLGMRYQMGPLLHHQDTTTPLLCMVYYRVSPTCIHRLHLSSTGGLLYVTTGVHGGHVLVGMLLLLVYSLQGHAWCMYSSASTDGSHGIVGVIMY